MNLWDQVAKIPEGLKHLKEWIGDGGQVVDPEIAQARANICNGNTPTGHRCENNDLSASIAAPVAEAVKRGLEIKNGLDLRVQGEKALGTCSACGCSLRLIVWEEPDRIRLQTDEAESANLPAFCWKLKP